MVYYRKGFSEVELPIAGFRTMKRRFSFPSKSHHAEKVMNEINGQDELLHPYLLLCVRTVQFTYRSK
jgi:hypothetical protein